jgi:adenosine deaminase
MQTPNRLIACVALLVAARIAAGQVQVPEPRMSDAPELRATRNYDAAVKAGPLALNAFLIDFPKGADLHVHLSGAVYAESFIRAAGEDGLCVDPAALSFAHPPCDAPLVPAIDVPANQSLYDHLVDSFSLRSFVPTPGFSGHDQFFATFDRFGGLGKRHLAQWIDEVASRSAAQNQQYLELMQTPAFSHAAQVAHEVGWDGELARFRQALLDHGLKDEVAAGRDEVRTAETDRKQMERCGTAQASSACQVEVRYIYQVLRAAPPERVFAQALLGFETIQASMDAHEDTWVGINFVQPEDAYLSMKDYSLHMKMMEYLHSVYPRVHVSLHAGELAPGLVPPEGLRFHIRQAVQWGHAERIGHGVDVMYEDDPTSLMSELARKHVMIEINLSSNEGILGVKGAEHPFPLYLAAHVPVALSTDDEGVSRIDLTHEYVRAALDYHLAYRDLKQLARTGMEHSFLPGQSLWAVQDAFNAPVEDCKGQPLGAASPSTDCKAFLDANEKAAAQWELERRIHAFEAKF